jgi:hypothetical protein
MNPILIGLAVAVLLVMGLYLLIVLRRHTQKPVELPYHWPTDLHYSELLAVPESGSFERNYYNAAGTLIASASGEFLTLPDGETVFGQSIWVHGDYQQKGFGSLALLTVYQDFWNYHRILAESGMRVVIRPNKSAFPSAQLMAFITPQYEEGVLPEGQRYYLFSVRPTGVNPPC